MQLSFSTIQKLYECPYSWINKQACTETDEFDYLGEGRKIHREIQDHISGKCKLDKYANLTYKFPIVEECDKDENTHFVYKISEELSVHGYRDGINLDEHRFCEIKPKSSYSFKDYIKSYQRKIYVLGDPMMTTSVLILYHDRGAEQYLLPNRPTDKEDALKWIVGAYSIIQKAEFEKGDKANCFRCIYRSNCEKRNQ